MTDETKRDVKKSNKIKIWIKHSIWDKISPSFASVWRFLKQKIKLIFQFSPNSKNVCGFSHFTSGYVQILAVVCIPVLLFGAKYLLDYRTLSDRNVTQGIGKRLVKQCAVNAALNVAQKWNPALTYAKQKTAMLRIADEIYNTSKAYLDSPLVQAAHGINMKKKVMTSGGTYDPFNSTASTESLQTEFDPKKKQIVPKTEKTNECRYYFYYHYETNHAPMATQHFDIMYNSLKQTNSNLFPPDEDLYQDYTYYCYCDNIDDPSGAGVKWFHYVTWPEVVGMYKSDGTPKKVETKSYTTRANPNDETVKIEIEDDKIKVTTDDDVAYAVPAECNVDIILTVPTNSAALNPDNLDKNTPTSGTPYISTSKDPTDEAKSTPIYQITRAYQKFLKDNFFYTRGVNVGVIPYSGKVSLRNDKSDWVREPDKFVDDGNTKIVGAILYGTKGEKNVKLTEVGSFAGGDISYGLLCRGSTENYGTDNKITKGDLLLSTTDPEEDTYKFRKMVYNPCYLTDANLLSMRCEKKGNKYWMNPYFILEMNPDVKFIYNMLGAFYPYYDDRDVSNFIFIPVTWANNLLQGWSATGKNSAINTSDDSKNLGRLSTPSKGTKVDGRKKALILIVNKPDWFEPGELTYLGFDNDYSETLAVESDFIRFDKGQTSGAKGILKYSGDSSEGTFSFLRKGLLRITVEPTGSTGKIKFTNVSGSYPSATKEIYVTKRSEFFITSDQMKDCSVGITLTGTELVSAEITNRPYKIENNKAVYTALTAPNRSVYIDLLKQSDDGKFDYDISGVDSNIKPNNHLIYGSDGDGKISDVGIKYQAPTYVPPARTTTSSAIAPALNPNASNEPTKWTSEGVKIDTGKITFYRWNSVCFGEVKGKGRFVAVSGGEFDVRGKKSNVAAYSDDGITWHKTKLPSSENWQSVCYGNGKFVAVACYSEIFAISDDGETWKEIPLSTYAKWVDPSWHSVVFTEHYKTPDNKNMFVAASFPTTNVAWMNEKCVLSDADGVPEKYFQAISSYRDTLIGSNGYSVFKHNYNGNTWDKTPNLYEEMKGKNPIKSVISGGSGGNSIYAMTEDGKFCSWGPSDSFDKWSQLSDLPKSKGKEYYWQSMCSGKCKVVLKVPCIVAVAEGDDDRSGTLARWVALLGWEETKFADKNQQWKSVCWGEVEIGDKKVGRFVAVSGANNVAAYSDNGIDWTKVSMPTVSFKSVCSGGGKFVALYDSDYAAYSDDGKNWTIVELPSANWQSVCYGNGKFVAVGGKKVIFSNDGVNWQEDKSQVSYGGKKSIADTMGNKNGEWRSVCYGDEQFVVISDQVDRLYGTIGEWDIYPGGADYKMSSICYGDGKFMMVGENSSTSFCVPSTDLNNVSIATLAEVAKFWRSVCYGNGKFVAVSESGWKVYSTDGNNWKAPTTDSSGHWTSVCYGNGMFVAVSKKDDFQEKSYVSYSSNSINKWTRIELPDGDWESVCYSGKLGRFVAVGSSGVAYCDIKVTVKYVAVGDYSGAFYSSNGIDWYESDLPTYFGEYMTTTNWSSVCYGNGKFVAIGSDGKIGCTTSGAHWNVSNSLSNKGVWKSVCYGNGKFVAVDREKAIAYCSSDNYGMSWQVSNALSEGASSNIVWRSVCYGNGRFVAVGDKKAAYSTDDGKTWKQVTKEPMSEGNWRSVCYGNKKFVAVGSGKMAYSTDGENWIKVDTEAISSRNWYSVCYGDGEFVAFGVGIAAYSTDGENWTKVNTELIFNGNWQSVCYGDGKFVAIGHYNETGIVAYSSNGMIWKESSLPDSGFVSVAAVRDEEPEIEPIERGWSFYNNSGSNSINHHFIFPTNSGDMYFVTNSEEFTYKNGNIYPMVDANGFFVDVDNTYFDVNDGVEKKYLGSGLYRWTMPAEKTKSISLSLNANAHQFYWSVKSLGSVSLPTLYAGATLPINAALFTGKWQSTTDGKNWNGKNATEAVKEVTRDACEKLKTDWSDDLRVYLIKYRAQTGDYSYLNDCATANTTDYVKNVSNESELKDALEAIAENIINWAGRTEAKNTY